jgi:putative intracellular protease/amidase
MSGLVAILGGQEHRPGVESIDRRLLAEAGMTHPTVTVLLAATVPARIQAKIAEAVAYWPRLGARVRFAYTGGGDGTEQALAALTDPDLVVLTGGRPWLIQRRLTPPVVDRLRRLSADGVPLSGSSAGAMALAEWRLHLQPGRAPRLRPGMGLIPGMAAPHYGRHATHHASRVIAYRHPGLPILGLQDRTALVGRHGDFQVMGVGGCTVLRGARGRYHPRGVHVTLRGGWVAAGPGAPAPVTVGAHAPPWPDVPSADIWRQPWTTPVMTGTITQP